MNRKARRASDSKGIQVSKTNEQLQQDYNLFCAQAGELQFRISKVRGDLAKLSDELNTINQKIENTLKAASAAPAPTSVADEKLEMKNVSEEAKTAASA